MKLCLSVLHKQFIFRYNCLTLCIPLVSLCATHLRVDRFVYLVYECNAGFATAVIKESAGFTGPDRKPTTRM